MRRSQSRLERIVVVGLAAWRLARIIPHDTVAHDVRRKLTMWAVAGDGAGSSDRNPRQWLVSLVTCPVCAGFWVSGVLTVLGARRSGVPSSGTRRRHADLQRRPRDAGDPLDLVLDWWAAAAVVALAESVSGSAD